MTQYIDSIPDTKSAIEPLIKNLRLPQSIIDQIAKNASFRSVTNIDSLITQANLSTLQSVYAEYTFSGKFTTSLYFCPTLTKEQAEGEIERIIRRTLRLPKESTRITFLKAHEFELGIFAAFLIEGPSVFVQDTNGHLS